eukprot:362182-Chlamydomonas_euryale.AAC.11
MSCRTQRRVSLHTPGDMRRLPRLLSSQGREGRPNHLDGGADGDGEGEEPSLVPSGSGDSGGAVVAAVAVAAGSSSVLFDDITAPAAAASTTTAPIAGSAGELPLAGAAEADGAGVDTGAGDAAGAGAVAGALSKANGLGFFFSSLTPSAAAETSSIFCASACASRGWCTGVRCTTDAEAAASKVEHALARTSSQSSPQCKQPALHTVPRLLYSHLGPFRACIITPSALHSQVMYASVKQSHPSTLSRTANHSGTANQGRKLVKSREPVRAMNW